MVYFWLAVMVALVTIDILTSGFLFIWFGIGALISLMTSKFLSLPYQIIIFVGTGTFLTFIFYPKVKRTLSRTDGGNTLITDRLIGKEFICEKDIKKQTECQLLLGGSYWYVVSNTDIKKNEKFIVLKNEHNKLIIEKKGDI